MKRGMWTFLAIIMLLNIFLAACADEGTPPAQSEVLPSSTPTVDHPVEQFDWGEIRWKLQQGEQIPLGALAIGALPATQADGPVLPIADIIVGGILFSVWIYNDGPQQAAEAVVQGYNGLVEFGNSYSQTQLQSIPLVDYRNFVDGPLFTVNHEESAWVIETLNAKIDRGELKTNNKQGCETGAISNGTVCIFAGMNPPSTGGPFEGHVAILMGQPTNFGPKLVFAVVNGQMQSFEGTAPPAGSNRWVRMGDTPYYLDRQSIYWKAAWFLAERSNGKRTHPELWFDVGKGWEKWLLIKERYNLVVPLASIPIPGLIQRVNNWMLSNVRPQ